MSDVCPEWYRFRNAIYRADLPASTSLLQEHPSLLDARNGIGETVLHFLAVENCLHGIEWLHKQGASLNSTNKFGMPLLFEVAQLGYRDIFVWLIAHGADTTQKNSDDHSIRDYLAEVERPDMIEFINEHITPDT